MDYPILYSTSSRYRGIKVNRSLDAAPSPPLRAEAQASISGTLDRKGDIGAPWSVNPSSFSPKDVDFGQFRWPACGFARSPLDKAYAMFELALALAALRIISTSISCFGCLPGIRIACDDCSSVLEEQDFGSIEFGALFLALGLAIPSPGLFDFL